MKIVGFFCEILICNFHFFFLLFHKALISKQLNVEGRSWSQSFFIFEKEI
jgi:hypothetical protein